MTLSAWLNFESLSAGLQQQCNNTTNFAYYVNYDLYAAHHDNMVTSNY